MDFVLAAASLARGTGDLGVFSGEAAVVLLAMLSRVVDLVERTAGISMRVPVGV